LDQQLKTAFPGMDIPKFPSKYAIVNKTETRMKSFHSYLNKVLEICRPLSPLAKDNMMKYLAEFLDLRNDDEESKEPMIKHTNS
jgi:hypothetical protein